MGPSIYDTAQVLRFAPPADRLTVVSWLLEQQLDDGGWGHAFSARARLVPTLASVLALSEYQEVPGATAAVEAGLEFVRAQGIEWEGKEPEDLPVGAELILPRLLADAAGRGMAIDPSPFAAVIALGQRRHQILKKIRPKAGAPAIHSWEGWGAEPELSVFDESVGLSSSPAATAAWLHAARAHNLFPEAQLAAQRYLDAAAGATGLDIPGIVPTAWPIDRFEQVFGLHILFLGGALDHPALADVVEERVADLARAMKPDGLGYSDAILSDGDDTATALTVLHALGYPVDMETLMHYYVDPHFCNYHGELQASTTATAHAAYALALLGVDCPDTRVFLESQQLPNGRWHSDKWNNSWLYATGRVLLPLAGRPEHRAAVRRALHALLESQQPDGGWGEWGSSVEETAYGVMALRTLLYADELDEAGERALGRGERWLLMGDRPTHAGTTTCWQAKEAYRPLRISRVVELVATLPRRVVRLNEREVR